MNFINSSIFLFISSFILNYYITSSLFLNNLSNFTNNINRFYHALYKSLWMLLISSGIFLFFNHNFHPYITLLFFISILTTFFLARNQIGITDKQYLKNIIQIHANTVIPNEAILQKTKNPLIKQLAEKILIKDNEIISESKKLLNQLNNPNK